MIDEARVAQLEARVEEFFKARATSPEQVAPSPGEAPAGNGQGDATSPVPPAGADAIAAPDPRDLRIAELEAGKLADAVANVLPSAAIDAQAVAELVLARGGSFVFDDRGEVVIEIGEKRFPLTSEGLVESNVVPHALIASRGKGGTGSGRSYGAGPSDSTISDRAFFKMSTAQRRAHQEAAGKAAK